MLKLSFQPYDLRLNRVFRISRGSRDRAPLMLTRLSLDGVHGYGEASMPPLYGESVESATKFLSAVDLSGFTDPFDTESILQYVDAIAPGNAAAKTAVDIALHDLVGKLLRLPVHRYFGLPAVRPCTSMTIGLDTPERMAERAGELSGFRYLKIKLGTDNDRAMITAIRSVTQQPFFVDANQGWKNKEEALDLVYWLKEQGAVFIEQPMPRDDVAGNTWLTERSPLPTVGDEAVQRLTDIRTASSTYHGINIKLMKCTGLREGFKLAVSAKALGMRVMLGCMTETSCAISAAAQLGALADWVDLDGHLDTANNPYTGVTLSDGRLVLPGTPGIGLTKENNNLFLL
ncbi:dipeptide epimerase [Sinomicrobium soli]|uniref:dipeptide epimerase n=1 Tax=Sinomicrobium sp. N-1-3-6 TaxID=2219864 RepID=UPI000DCBD1FE|nr:dipeptide epimerase [Sinomicrobium sp. N-1-3-6]RAV30221.1 dipeptide epimerase [Sinomicrobium sp. N-1-3-6]